MSQSRKDSDLEGWEKIPVPTLCQWWIMMRILERGKPLSIYELTNFAKGLDVCEDAKMTRYRITVLLELWQRFGLIKIEKQYERGRTKEVVGTEKCKAFAKKVRYWYEGYIT